MSAVEKTTPVFRKEDIDRAIVCTVADLDGWNHPIGLKMDKGKDQKGFVFIPGQLLSFASGHGTSIPSFEYDPGNVEEVANACRVFAASCDGWQKQAVQHLLKMILKDNTERHANKTESQKDWYLPISMDNRFGDRLMPLCEAFEVKLPRE